MTEAFKVVTRLELKGTAPEKMLKFAKNTMRAYESTKKLSAQMTLVNRKFLTLDTRLERLLPKSAKLAADIKIMNSGAQLSGKSFSYLNIQMDKNIYSTANLSRQSINLSENIKKISADALMATESLAAMRHESKLSSIRIPRTRIRISRTRIGVDPNLGGRRSAHMPYHALHHIGLGGVGSKLGGLSAIGRFGGAGMMAGFGGAMLMHSGFEKNMEYEKKIAQFRSIGFTDDQVQEIRSLTGTAKPGISPIRQIDALRDAQMATRKFSDAILLSPSLQKIKFISDSMFSGLNDEQMQAMVKFAEMRGGADPEKIKQELVTGTQMYTTSGSTIKPTDLLNFVRMFTISSHMSREALLALEPTIQERGGSQSGTALQTFFGRTQGNSKLISKADKKFLNKIGLFEHGVIKKSYGQIFNKDPEEFYEKVWLPLLKSKGITSPEDIAKAESHLGRTPSKFFGTMGKNIEKAHRAREQGSKLLELDDLMKIAFQTPGGASIRFMNALESLTNAFGKFNSPGAVKFLNSMSFLIEKLTNAYSNSKSPGISSILSPTKDPITGKELPQFLHFFNKSPVTDPKSEKKETHVTVNLDGQKIGKVVAKHTADAMTRGGTQSASSGINPRSLPQPTGLNTFGGYN